MNHQSKEMVEGVQGRNIQSILIEKGDLTIDDDRTLYNTNYQNTDESPHSNQRISGPVNIQSLRITESV